MSVTVPTVERAFPPSGLWSTMTGVVKFSMASTCGRSYFGNWLRMNKGKVALSWRWASTATVSKTMDDFPEPDTPTNTVIRSFGISSETSLRLFSRAPTTRMLSRRLTSFLSARVPLVGSSEPGEQDRHSRGGDQVVAQHRHRVGERAQPEIAVEGAVEPCDVEAGGRPAVLAAQGRPGAAGVAAELERADEAVAARADREAPGHPGRTGVEHPVDGVVRHGAGPAGRQAVGPERHVRRVHPHGVRSLPRQDPFGLPCGHRAHPRFADQRSTVAGQCSCRCPWATLTESRPCMHQLPGSGCTRWTSGGEGEVAAMAGQEVKTAKRSSPMWMALKVGVSLVLVVGIFYYLLTGIELGQVWAEIRAMTWREDLILAVIA